MPVLRRPVEHATKSDIQKKPLLPASQDYPAIDDGIDEDNGASEDQLCVVVKTRRIKNRHYVVPDKITVITSLPGRHAYLVRDGGGGLNGLGLITAGEADLSPAPGVSFGGNPFKLRHAGLENKLKEVNRKAVKAAAEARKISGSQIKVKSFF